MLTESVTCDPALRDRGSPTLKRLTDTSMPALICARHVELKGAQGSLRIAKESRDGSPSTGEECARRSMTENGIRAKYECR